MLTFAKLLKILLPVASVTSATLTTTSLVTFRNQNHEKQKQKNDTLLVDFENPIKEFEERVLFYSKDGKGQGDVSLDKENAEKLKKHVENNQDLNKGLENGGSVPDEVREPVSGEKTDHSAHSDLNNLIQRERDSNQEDLLNSEGKKDSLDPQKQIPKSEKVDEEGGSDGDSSKHDQTPLESQPKGDREGNNGGEETGEPSPKIENNENDGSVNQTEKGLDEANRNDNGLNSSENQNERNEDSSSEGLKPTKAIQEDNQMGQNSDDVNSRKNDEIKGESNSIASVEQSSSEKHGRSDGTDSGLDSSGVNSINQERLRELQELEERLQASRAQLENILSSSGVIK